jgi:hypothetical protein
VYCSIGLIVSCRGPLFSFQCSFRRWLSNVTPQRYCMPKQGPQYVPHWQPNRILPGALGQPCGIFTILTKAVLQARLTFTAYLPSRALMPVDEPAICAFPPTCANIATRLLAFLQHELILGQASRVINLPSHIITHPTLTRRSGRQPCIQTICYKYLIRTALEVRGHSPFCQLRFS